MGNRHAQEEEVRMAYTRSLRRNADKKAKAAKAASEAQSRRTRAQREAILDIAQALVGFTAALMENSAALMEHERNSKTKTKKTKVEPGIKHRAMRQDQSEVVVHGFLRGVDGVCDDVAALVLAYYHSWLQIGDEIDARDKAGKWYSAVIRARKAKGQPLIDAFPKGMNRSKSEIPDEFEAVYVHYTAFETKWDQWIVVDPSRSGTVCRCPGPCQTSKNGPFTHRLALRDTQSQSKKKKKCIKKSVRGNPLVPGSVGLVNIDAMSLVNSVMQCMAHCPQLQSFFESGTWWQDLNTTSSLGTQGKLAIEMAKLLTQMWSAEYQVISPRTLQSTLNNYADANFGGWKQRDAMKFVNFILNFLHEDLNRVENKPRAQDSGRRRHTNESESDAAVCWKNHLKQNQSKIVELFHAQQKVSSTCPDCRKSTTTFETYTHLSLSVTDDMSVIVDIFNVGITRKDKESPNKPTRHVFHVKKYDKVKKVAALIAQKFRAKPHLVLLYENNGTHVTRELDENLTLEKVSTLEAIACYILKNWNAVVTPTEIKQKKISLALCKLSHYAPSSKKMFGMPLLISFLNIHSARELHQTVYRRLHAWVGTSGNVLAPPPDSDEDERWNALLASDALPYRLCYRYSASQSSDSQTYQCLPNADAPFPSAIRDRNEISLRVEWSDSAFAVLKTVMNKVVVDVEYEKWKKTKQSKDRHLNLYDCLNAYISREFDENDYMVHCPRCKKYQNVTKKFDLLSCPELLIIHLKRFGSDGAKKSSTFVDCPIRGLDLTPYLINDGDQSQPGPFVYDLFAVSCHSDGSRGEGCHTAYALNAETKQWLYFNDSSVQFAKQSDIISQATHVLFYKKRH